MSETGREATCPLAQRDAAVFLHQAGSSPVARAITVAEGARFRDSAGHWVYDLHGNGCHHLGYGHPRLVAAVEHQMRTLPFAPRRFTNPQAVALAEALVIRWPGGPGRVLFAPSGSDAVDIALKLARLATGGPGRSPSKAHGMAPGWARLRWAAARPSARAAWARSSDHAGTCRGTIPGLTATP
jgi:4-aminobutyrate aminotransferase-like enzyme